MSGKNELVKDIRFPVIESLFSEGNVDVIISEMKKLSELLDEETVWDKGNDLSNRAENALLGLTETISLLEKLSDLNRINGKTNL